ncbi:PAS domain-containing sensor histidine kinase [Lentisphaera marina]|uniref:PAS domain-containing sensor histidine kinase n=1 Tax=Lentisphaera marina TaxID=1111041 RepID=UPI002367038A|nr:PAS domain-containing sensor histidine kinase [Lentisphaera marina]MDD7985514.1 PAS domain-containing sensor histidine kinase [Lentisphaera marina]
MFNKSTVLTWSTWRLAFISFSLLFIFFYAFYLRENKKEINYVDPMLNHAAKLVLNSQISESPLSSDEIISTLAKEHDAFVYVVNNHGLMLHSSIPSIHQFSDINTLDKLTLNPDTFVYTNTDYSTGKHFIRCYLPYLSPELPTEPTFLIIDKALQLDNPYLKSLVPALWKALIISSIILIFYVWIIAAPIAVQVQAIQDGFIDENGDSHPNYTGIVELMKIRQTQDSFLRHAKENHEQLNTEIQHWEGFFNTIPAGLILVDHENSIINANERSFKLFHVKALSKPKGAFLMAAYKNSDLSRLSNDFIKSEDEFSETEIQVIRQGEELNLNVKLVRISLNQHEEENGLIIVINDITRIRQLEKLRKDFVSNVSHELKTPITVTLGFLEAFEESLDDPDQARYFFNIIQRNTHRLNNIIQDLLTLSRLETQEKIKRFGYEKKDILNTLNNTIDLVSEEIKERNVDLETDIFAHEVKLNHGLIELAIRNLLENAIRYCDPENAKVKLTMTRKDKELRIKVSDNGPGIPNQFHERIFQRFFRIDESRDRNTGGSGLGLSIVKHIIQLHQGSIVVDSTLGQGTSFTLVIPK